MNIEKYIVTLFAIVLILSTVGAAVENASNAGKTNITDTSKANITIISKSVEIDKNSSKEIVLIYIDSSKTGHLNYLEKYYSQNATGGVNLDSAIMYYNETMPNNTFTLKIKRPLDNDGNQYRLIKALIYIDNKKEFDTWFKFGDKNKESPGFDIIVAIISMISIVYLLKIRK